MACRSAEPPLPAYDRTWNRCCPIVVDVLLLSWLKREGKLGGQITAVWWTTSCLAASCDRLAETSFRFKIFRPFLVFPSDHPAPQGPYRRLVSSILWQEFLIAKSFQRANTADFGSVDHLFSCAQ